MIKATISSLLLLNLNSVKLVLLMLNVMEGINSLLCRAIGVLLRPAYKYSSVYTSQPALVAPFRTTILWEIVRRDTKVYYAQSVLKGTLALPPLNARDVLLSGEMCLFFCSF